MQQITFRRQSYTQLWAVLNSNESLDLLPSGGYVEDYFGNPSQITLHNIVTDVRIPLFFTDTSSTSLSGYIPLNTISDGTYRFEGYLQDLMGNKAIIGEVSSPSITGTVIVAELTILATIGIGAILNVTFQNQDLNFQLVLVEDAQFESALRDGFENSLVFADSVNIDVGIRSKFWYSVNLLPEVDPLLP